MHCLYGLLNTKSNQIRFKYNSTSHSTDENTLVEVRAVDSEVVFRIYDLGMNNIPLYWGLC